jgi:hypothetical protein
MMKSGERIHNEGGCSGEGGNSCDGGHVGVGGEW